MRRRTGVVLGVTALAAATLLVGLPAAQGGGISAPVETWEALHDGPAHADDWSRDVAVSPDGTRVFVTGEDHNAAGRDYVTIAYDAGGDEVWRHRHTAGEWAETMAVAPAGDVVVVTGFGAGVKLETVAIDVASGTTRWAHTYLNPDTPSWTWDMGEEVAFTPDGSTVLVTGTARGTDGSDDVVTLALDAATGRQRWKASFAGPLQGDEYLAAMALSPDGARAYVAASTAAGPTGGDIVLLAYDVATGALAWSQSHDLDGRRDQPTGLAVGPDGRIYVAGAGLVGGDGLESYDGVVLALSATGALLWERRDLSVPGLDSPGFLRVSNDGSRLFAAGGLVDPTGFLVSAGTVVARATGDGTVLWATAPLPGHYSGPADVALTPDGLWLLVGGNVDLGSGWDYGVALLSADDGRIGWTTRYDGPGAGYDTLRAVAVSPDGRRGYVTGAAKSSLLGTASMDYTTLAYCLPLPKTC